MNKVAHLTGWRRRTVNRLRAEGRAEPEPPPPWPAYLQTDDEINHEHDPDMRAWLARIQKNSEK